jgi:hypothetical protein
LTPNPDIAPRVWNYKPNQPVAAVGASVSVAAPTATGPSTPSCKTAASPLSAPSL